MQPRARPAVIAAALLGALALGAIWVRSAQQSLAQPEPRDEFAYAGSTACQSCHPDHHASWARTYHRTMTQEASAKSVQGAFDGQIVRYWGQPVRPTKQGEQFVFEYLDRNGQIGATVPVARTVGSHRYQQYLAKADGGRYQRLPLIWHNGEQRWIHYNGAFLYDDAQRFDQHAATWNPNCIYCHNTGPEPRISNADELFQRLKRGERFNYLSAAHWDSQVAELGIACEACHGPGAQHAAANRNPVRRYWLHLSGRADPSIVNPRRLTPERAAQVCGQCHGQRTPARPDLVDRWLSRGPTYRAGEDLQQHVNLVMRDSPVPPGGDPDLFRLRFWPDGTPRLSAYELQGLMQSTCYTRGGATCIGCHEAHGGDPAGMITDENREGASCIGCHQGIEQTVPAHVRHAASGARTNCVDCHMPRLAYGVMEIHRSHRIQNPAPAANAAGQRPDACTSCHGDRSADWAQTVLRGWRGESVPAPADAIPENLRQLFGGDPVQRAVAARLAGAEHSALTPVARRAQLPLLFAAMEDRYPAVRRFAWMSARQTATRLGDESLQQALAGFDFIAEAASRAQVLQDVRRQFRPVAVADRLGGLLLSDGRVDEARIEALRAQADTRAINIGE